MNGTLAVERPPAARGPQAPGPGQSGPPAPPPSPSRHGPPRIVILLLVLAAAGGGAWSFGFLDVGKIRDRLPWKAKEDRSTIVMLGNVDVRQVNLAFKVDGRIQALAVDEGDAVKAGSVIASLDRRYFDDEVRTAKARRDALAATLARLEHGSRPEEIAQARALVDQRAAEVHRAQVDFRRSENLLERQSVSRQEYDHDEAAAREAVAQLAYAREALRLAEIGPRVEDIANARAQLAEADAELVRIDRRLADSRLIAPGDGVILTRAREVGAIVQPGEVVFTLTLATPVWVRTYIDEPDLGDVRPGAEVEVVTDSRPSSPCRGHVGYISPTAEFTPKTVETPELRTQLVYRVRVVVDNPDGGLRQGMPVTVRLPRPRGEVSTP
ncbi:Macrolide export protein MacA [Aquisphaera giovannonii]|uniref:Macrolide export protein MacA n=1 Tax=Aquisphaera giovannonii TaxID=406548 RepID=A0A5B9VW61_9BACT|nr:secretion protein HlyD [Aquisphaera giovannonii]QEH32304.1 Macrolide export protein MacA [Aquisphaera giovannonii]